MVRHCETELSNEKRYSGSVDVPLNDAGRKHAESLAEHLEKADIKKIYCSGLKRAYETADIISRPHRLEVDVVQGLNEADFGGWEGLTFDEVLLKDKEKAQEYLRNPSGFRFPGGEGLLQLNERVLRAMDLILKKHLNPSNETVLVVSHGGSNRVILGKALNLSLEDQFRLRQDNGCINVVDFFEETTVVSLINYTPGVAILNPGKCVKSCEKCAKEKCYSF